MYIIKNRLVSYLDENLTKGTNTMVFVLQDYCRIQRWKQWVTVFLSSVCTLLKDTVLWDTTLTCLEADYISLKNNILWHIWHLPVSSMSKRWHRASLATRSILHKVTFQVSSNHIREFLDTQQTSALWHIQLFKTIPWLSCL